jgi:endonuclease YncB( thermonuclease family)
LAGQFKVVPVYDGDTVKAIAHNITIKARVVGIDATKISLEKSTSLEIQSNVSILKEERHEPGKR